MIRFLEIPPVGAPKFWTLCCEGLDPLEAAFGPEGRHPRPRAQDVYFLARLDGRTSIGMIWIQRPSPTTAAFGMGLFVGSRGRGLGPKVRDAAYDFIFQDKTIHKLESEVYCLDPDTKVLDAEALAWRPIGGVKVGDRLVSFDEINPGRSQRRIRRAHVLGVRWLVAPALRMELDNGRAVVCSSEHRWLCASKTGGNQAFRRASSLKRGQKVKYLGAPWAEDRSRDAGYLAGIIDGEGYFRSSRRLCGQTTGFQIGFSQNPGAVLDEALRVCRVLGFSTTAPRPAVGSSVLAVEIRGLYQVLRLLGQVRPVRLLEKYGDHVYGRMAMGSWPSVTALEKVSRREVVAIETDTGTFFANGLYSHNSSNAHSLGALHGPLKRARQEGRQRETIQIHGAFYDRLLYGITRREWQEVRLQS